MLELMGDCIFCKIAAKQKQEEIYLETDTIIVFPDHDPKTPTHLLLVPKEHFDDFSEMMKQKPELLKEIGELIEKIMGKPDQKSKKYTWGFQCGGNQSVGHVHAQLLTDLDGPALVL